MNELRTLRDAFYMGLMGVLSLFIFVAAMRIWAADSPGESVEVFAQSVSILVLVALPTSEIGIILAMIMATVGAAIPLSGRNPHLILAAVFAGMGWGAANILVKLVFGI
ncbi:hypothetical protein [Natronorubrum tibetense]|nr:hypothetical protein [Natronorubrum tibetense]